MVTFIDFVRYPFWIYGIVGIHLFDWNTEQTSRKFFEFLLVLNLLLIFTTKLSYTFFGEFENYKDITLFISYWAFVLNSMAKFSTLWLGRSVLEKSYRQLESSFPRSTALRNDYRLNDYYKQNNYLQKMLSILHFGTLLMFNFMPLMQSLYEYYAAAKEERVFIYRLSYMLYYPFDETRPVTYAFVYLQQCFGAFSLSCLFMGSDLLLIAMVSQINMHLEYLSKRILEINPNGTDEDIKELASVIGYHKDILLSCEKIEETFSPSILLNFCASGFVICMMAVQIVSGADGIIFLKFVCFLITAQAHVYYICHFGTNLITLSTDISDAFCHHQWYEANVKYQKMLPLAIARAQKPVYLTANTFFVVSMTSFKTLMTTSYQFFTLLSSTLTE